MADTFEEGLRAEIEALRRFRTEQEERRAEESERTDQAGGEIDNLEWPQVRALIAMRFETARLTNRLAEAERRLTELEQAVGRT